MATRKQQFTGYVMKHVASGLWHPGDATLKVYDEPHEGMADYPRFDPPTWVPVRVVVTEAPAKRLSKARG